MIIVTCLNIFLRRKRNPKYSRDVSDTLVQCNHSASPSELIYCVYKT